MSPYYPPSGGGSSAPSTPTTGGYFSCYMVNTSPYLIGVGAGRNAGYYVASCFNAVNPSTVAMVINSAVCVAFTASRDINADTMAFRLTAAGSLTSIVQLGIYSDSGNGVLFPYQAISTSSYMLSGSDDTMIGYNPAVTLTANNLYWFVILGSRAGGTSAALSLTATYPIFGTNSSGTAYSTSLIISINQADSAGLQPIMVGSGRLNTSSPPMLMVRAAN